MQKSKKKQDNEPAILENVGKRQSKPSYFSLIIFIILITFLFCLVYDNYSNDDVDYDDGTGINKPYQPGPEPKVEVQRSADYGSKKAEITDNASEMEVNTEISQKNEQSQAKQSQSNFFASKIFDYLKDSSAANTDTPDAPTVQSVDPVLEHSNNDKNDREVDNQVDNQDRQSSNSEKAKLHSNLNFQINEYRLFLSSATDLINNFRANKPYASQLNLISKNESLKPYFTQLFSDLESYNKIIESDGLNQYKNSKIDLGIFNKFFSLQEKNPTYLDAIQLKNNIENQLPKLLQKIYSKEFQDYFFINS